MQLRRYSEWISTTTVSTRTWIWFWLDIILGVRRLFSLIGGFIILLLLRPFIIIDWEVSYVHSFKKFCHFIIGAPPLVRDIKGHHVFIIFNKLKFKVVKKISIKFCRGPLLYHYNSHGKRYECVPMICIVVAHIFLLNLN